METQSDRDTLDSFIYRILPNLCCNAVVYLPTDIRQIVQLQNHQIYINLSLGENQFRPNVYV